MKTLTLLRHAKSSWGDPGARDFDRPLNARGRHAACAIGREMKALGLRFDRVVASPAVRVVETLGEVSRGLGSAIEPDYDERVYLASPGALIEIVRGMAESIERLLLVGHNPGLERLALMLSGDQPGALRAQLKNKYPTGTIAEIGLPVTAWGEVAEGIGSLDRFIRPRDLDPGLGPDRGSD